MLVFLRLKVLPRDVAGYLCDFLPPLQHEKVEQTPIELSVVDLGSDEEPDFRLWLFGD